MTAALTPVAVNYAAIAPMLVVVTGALLGVVFEAFAPRSSRHTLQLGLTLVTIAAAFVALWLWTWGKPVSTLGGSVVVDGPAAFMQGALLALAFVSVLVMAERFGGESADAFTPMGAATPGSAQEAAAARAGYVTSEVFPLTLLALFGMMAFVASADLITMFVALEVLSLPLYVMTGLARRRRLLSQEASLKYFLLGAFSSAFFLFGSALLYGYAGTTSLSGIGEAIGKGANGLEGLLLPGAVLVLVGLLFKVGAVPFHMWTPDAYQGAPTPVTGFMAACTKLAAFGALLRLAYVGLASDRWDWEYGVVVICLLTMVVGAVLSVTQVDVKRLLAYSSIAHAGFILVGVLAFDRRAVSGVLFYLVAYGFATVAAFAIIALVRQGGSEATHISQWAGLGKRHPVVAAVFTLLLLAFAGIPLTSGFVAKVTVFAPALATGGRAGVLLVIVGVLASAVTAFVYVRLIVLMYFAEPKAVEAGAEPVVALSPGYPTLVAVTIGAVATLLLGLVPSGVLGLVERTAEFLR